nr:MAG: hypothetical protein [Bacteriophage sp.]
MRVITRSYKREREVIGVITRGYRRERKGVGTRSYESWN